jgi:hypothetical protein
MYNTCICIVPVIFFSKLLGVQLYTHVHILRPPMAAMDALIPGKRVSLGRKYTY